MASTSMDRPQPSLARLERRAHVEWISELTSLVTAGRTFRTIMADPPWQFDNTATRGAAEDAYPTMSMAELKALPVRDLAATEAHLYLWTTVAHRWKAMKLVKTWGFHNTGEVIWVKPRKDRTALRMGTGNYFRQCHEIILLGVRGEATRLRRQDLPSVLFCPRGVHSRKPDLIRLMVEQASYGPYLELFGRELAEGWSVFGNEITSLVPIATSQPRCAFCHKIFTRQRRSKQYCDGNCRQQAHREKHSVTVDSAYRNNTRD
jgi:N6-adenosine-specific RNA methylase IME4